MKVIITILLLVSLGCSKPQDKIRPMRQQPFIIVNKSGWNDPTCIYYYQDRSGMIHSFIDRNNKHQVGDTL